jgi:hypothetical protein
MSGLMQLVAYGAQDVYLTGNPQITFFKVVYRRHTNFAVEGIAVPLTGSINFGSKATVTIQRNGDLMLQTYLRVVMKEVKDDHYTGRFAWVRRLGHALIEDVSLLIGGSQIDKHYGTWMDIWYELTHDISQERGYAQMIGDTPEITELSTAGTNGLIKPRFEMFIPLQFWFCRNPGLALPLIALQYHEVRMDFTIANKDHLFIASEGNVVDNNLDKDSQFKTSDAYRSLGIESAEVLVNYVYLDSEERRRFAQVGHEYLIEQLQFTGAQTINGTTSTNRTQSQYDLNFNHPSKELIWALKSGSFTTGESFLAYSSGLTPNAWNDALADAANNIANGMIVVSKEEITDRPDYFELKSIDGTAPTSMVTGSHELNYNVMVITNVISEEEQTEQGDTPPIGEAFHVYLIRDVLKCEHPVYNLGDKIEHIDIHVVCTESTTEGVTTDTYELDEVICLKHSLTMRDLSLPVRFFPVDKRVNKQDVVVYQHHNYGLFMDGSVNPVESGKIQLNGMDRFSTRSGKYFNYVQPYEHHTRTPADGINCYSFALKPEEHQPSGSANLSRIDKTTLNIAFNDPTFYPGLIPIGAFGNTSNLYIFDFNYNVLRIMSGMGGIAYSN